MFIGSTGGTSLGDVLTSTPSPIAITASIPGGPDGMKATLRIMRDYARAAVRDPDQAIRSKAEELTRGLPPRQWFAEIRAVHEFVRDSIRYLRDPATMERIATPEQTLKSMQGDCDDKATLLAALLDSIGHPTRFVAIGLGGGPFSHVLVETKVRHTGNDQKDWMPLETIIPRDAGWWPDGVTSAYRLKV